MGNSKLARMYATVDMLAYENPDSRVRILRNCNRCCFCNRIYRIRKPITMKTPKREYKKYYICPATGEPDEWTLGNIDARWKRKNREARLRKKIAKQAKEILWLKANLRCIKYIVNGAQIGEGTHIFIPTLEQYTP